jgi:ferredoxin
MAHIVTNKCFDCKFTDCVEVCPVACFYELDRQLVIHPDECIDCTACVSVCPVEAIFAEGDLPKDHEASIEFNAVESKRVKAEGKEAIVKKHDPLPTAAERRKALGH